MSWCHVYDITVPPSSFIMICFTWNYVCQFPKTHISGTLSSSTSQWLQDKIDPLLPHSGHQELCLNNSKDFMNIQVYMSILSRQFSVGKAGKQQGLTFTEMAGIWHRHFICFLTLTSKWDTVELLLSSYLRALSHYNLENSFNLKSCV